MLNELPVEKIKIRPERQRKDLGNLEELKQSILQVGLLNPIVVELVDGQYWLIAGERRYTAWTQLQSEGRISSSEPIRVTELSELDEPTKQLIELEENIKRKDLTWQEQVQAIAKLYSLKGFTSAQEAEPFFGLSSSAISKALQISSAMKNPKVAEAPTMSNAYSIVTRENARALDNMSMEINNFFKSTLTEEKPNDNGIRGSTQENPTALFTGQEIPAGVEQNSSRSEGESKPVYRIEQANFLQFARNYQGKPFDLVHLDLPYGINHDRSQQGNTASFGTYEDTEDIYKTLVRTFLENQDKLVAEKAHCICWLSLRFEEWTKKAFAEAGWACHMQPLIWHKSDNKGIIADVQCGFRNVCEYALFFNRGRKAVVKNISNLYSGPTTKRFHASEKPLPMLKYFFSGLCDHYSRVLDPTCGSGTAIMAAQYYGAEEALGLELDQSFAEKAQEWLKLEQSRQESLDLDLEGIEI